MRFANLWVIMLLFSFAAGRPAAGAPAGGARTVADDLLAQLDLSQPHLKEIGVLAARGETARALDAWRDQVVTRLRRHDFGEYGWHDYVLHPRPAGAVDCLAGVTPREQYLNSGMVGFVDIFGMSGPPGSGNRIRWFVDLDGPIEWGDPALAAQHRSLKVGQPAYPNFEFADTIVGRYWQTGNDVYLRKALEIMGDFSRHHRQEFWREYFEKGIDDKAVERIYRCDWRLNTNGLEVGWRLKNFLKILAGFSKCLGADKPKEWAAVLKPTTGPLTRAEMARIPAEPLAEFGLSLMRDHTGKLLWFCARPGAPPNQRAEGLKALAFLTAILPDFKATPQLVSYVDRAYEDFLDGNFLPDGGSLEQSFNYNGQDKEGLEELVRFFGDRPPSYAQRALAKVKARRAVDDGLQTPLGGLPQVGNWHDVRANNVWDSEAAAKRYGGSSDMHDREPIRPMPYLSTAFPYSGFYVLRSGWGMKDLYLFFMAGRPQIGHSMRDSNAIQVTAYGRQLVVCGGSPTYGRFATPEAKGADFYLSEASSLKNNTVLVDGRSQSKSGPYAARAYKTPVLSRWHTSPRYDLVDGLYSLGYGEFKDGRDANVDLSVEHLRRVVFIKPARLLLIEDRMINKGEKPHTYSQVWNFLPHCEHQEWKKSIAGFREDQFTLDAAAKRFRTTDPDGPNVEFLHFGPAVEYRKFHGSRDPWLGWFAAGIGDARPKVDIHAEWSSEESDALATLLIPLDKGQPSPVKSATPLAAGTARGLDALFQDGGRLRVLAGSQPEALEIAPVAVTGRSLLVYTAADGSVSGIVLGCRSLALAGKPAATEGDDFEFVLDGKGGMRRTPLFLPEVPVIAEPRPFTDVAHAPPVTIAGARERLTVRYTLDGSDPTPASPLYAGPFRLQKEGVVTACFFQGAEPLPLVARQEFRPSPWPLREPDLPAGAALEPGVAYRLFRFEKSIRLYDLMLRKPVESGRCETVSVEPWTKERDFGVLWEGYLRIPRDGMYHFRIHSPIGASLFVTNEARDLQVPAVAAASYRNVDDEGSIALRAGYHKVHVEYMQAWNAENALTVEVEGPGVPRQPLGAGWLFREKE